MNWDENGLTKLYDVLAFVESFASRPIEESEFTNIANSFLFLIQNIPLITIELDALGLLRSRPNKEGEIFSEEWQISYNSRCPNSIVLGRFNRQYESVFYGAVPTENENASMSLTSTLESCKEILDKNNDDPFIDLTIGQWDVKQVFWVVNLCIDNRHLDNNPRLKLATNKQIEKFRRTSPPNSFDLIIKFWNFISELSSRVFEDKSHYYLSTALFCTIRAHYEYMKVRKYENVYGIIYPSSMTQQQGLNIVLVPEAVDRFLELKKVCVYRYKRNPNNSKSYNVFPYSDLVNVIDRKFKFSKFDESENDF